MVEKVQITQQQWVRILTQKEMPAITSVAYMLDQYSNDDISSIPHLSNAILHDQRLSSCLLKVVNNSQRIAVSKVNTVSRAAIFIGIRSVKNICITSKKDGSIYLIYLVNDDQTSIPSQIKFPGYTKNNLTARILGMNSKLKWTNQDDGINIVIPENLKSRLLKTKAFVIKLK